MKGFAAARRGEREDMQDAHVIIEDFFTSHKSDTPYVTMICDDWQMSVGRTSCVVVC